MIERIRKHHLSFKNAFQGLLWVISTQHNFQIHLILSLIALSLCLALRVSGIETLIIIFAVVLGLGAEMINSALEAMTNLITIEWRKEAKIAKDVSAGMMLVISIGTLFIGLYIFIPKLTVLFLY